MTKDARRPAGLVALGCAALLGVAGCSAAPPGSAGSTASRAVYDQAPAAKAVPAAVQVTPAADADGVAPDTPVTVEVTQGDLEGVSVTDGEGREVAGTLEGGRWRSTQRLAPSADYEVAVQARGPDGSTGTQTSRFSTIEPEVTATYGLVHDEQTVGVAMPVSIQFDSPVTDPAYRRAVEQAVSVTTTPATEGSWGWLDDRQLMWRPEDFWQPGTEVTVDAPLTGYRTGPDKWVDRDVSGTMTIGREQLTTVDIADHTMTVTRGGRAIKTFPVSSGRPGPETETRSGMKVVLDKQREMTMDSATVGVDEGEPGYYKIDTDYNVRVTWTGEFLHSAPWSVGAQGSSNVSHGCVNLAPAAARWTYDNTLVGDPVDFTGSSREFQPTEGVGVWQYSWGQWQQRSALR